MIKYVLMSLLLLSPLASAGILADSTRAIYYAGDRNVTLMLANTNAYPVVVQVWTDNGEGNPSLDTSPFLVTPVIFRLDPAQRQSVTLNYNGRSASGKNEMLYWLNMYEIPPSKQSQADDNRVILPMNTQIKVFFRPDSLKGKSLSMGDISFYHDDRLKSFRIVNASRFNLSLLLVSLRGNRCFTFVSEVKDVVRPESSIRLPVPQHSECDFTSAEMMYVDDRGDIKKSTFTLSKTL